MLNLLLSPSSGLECSRRRCW